MPAVVLFLITLFLIVVGVVSCLQTPQDEMPGKLPRFIWLLIILLLSPLGALAWLIIRWVAKNENRNANGTVPLPRNPLDFIRGESSDSEADESKILPPDDNPDFLFSLEAQIQRKKLAEQSKQAKKQKGAEKLTAAGNLDQIGNSNNPKVLNNPGSDAPNVTDDPHSSSSSDTYDRSDSSENSDSLDDPGRADSSDKPKTTDDPDNNKN